MAVQDKLQSQRFELKYHVDEHRARSIRDFVLSHLVPDEFNDPEQNNSYPVNSLYIDSPNLTLCRDTLRGHKNRYKLRIRFYDERPESPTFFEIKQRRNDIIQKKRAAVRRESVMPILMGQVPTRTDLVDPDDGNALGAVRRFCELKDELKASGQAFVCYMREAYVPTAGNDVRVTFDRDLVARPFHDTIQMPPDHESVCPKTASVVLELKFTDRFPNWMHDLVTIFNLRRDSMPKYVECITSLRNDRGQNLGGVANVLRSELQ